MRKLATALPQTLKALGIARRTREAQALWLWPDVVGPDLARDAAAAQLRGGTLWVDTTSAALAHQLHLERSTLVERLNARLGMPVVREIRFRQHGPLRWR